MTELPSHEPAAGLLIYVQILSFGGVWQDRLYKLVRISRRSWILTCEELDCRIGEFSSWNQFVEYWDRYLIRERRVLEIDEL